MTLVIILKFFHYLALFLAGGLGIGAGIIQSAHKKAETPPAAPVQAALRTLAWLALVAIVILWISGIWLAYSLYGGNAAIEAVGQPDTRYPQNDLSLIHISEPTRPY